jgi:hypothetical protein
MKDSAVIQLEPLLGNTSPGRAPVHRTRTTRRGAPSGGGLPHQRDTYFYVILVSTIAVYSAYTYTAWDLSAEEGTGYDMYKWRLSDGYLLNRRMVQLPKILESISIDSMKLWQ